MKKIYIDEIQSKGDVSQPGPGKYDSPVKFGKRGLQYSMAARLPQDKLALEKSEKLPGPGLYEGTYKALCGKEMNNSMYKTTNNFSIGK